MNKMVDTVPFSPVSDHAVWLCWYLRSDTTYILACILTRDKFRREFVSHCMTQSVKFGLQCVAKGLITAFSVFLSCNLFLMHHNRKHSTLLKAFNMSAILLLLLSIYLFYTSFILSVSSIDVCYQIFLLSLSIFFLPSLPCYRLRRIWMCLSRS